MQFNLKHFLSKRRMTVYEWAQSNGLNSISDYDNFISSSEFDNDPNIRSELESLFSAQIQAPITAPEVQQDKSIKAVEAQTVEVESVPTIDAKVTDETSKENTDKIDDTEESEDKPTKKKRSKSE